MIKMLVGFEYLLAWRSIFHSHMWHFIFIHVIYSLYLLYIITLRTTTTHILPPEKMPFAQLVVGPPGAGKSTYCNGMQQFLGAIGRKASIVNLDPANDLTSYTAAIDVRSLITLEEIMVEDNLGPNGSILYALEEVESNIDWLKEKLRELGEDYVLFDCPGQVELFTHHDSLRKIFFALQRMGYRVCYILRDLDVVVLYCLNMLSCACAVFVDTEDRRRLRRDAEALLCKIYIHIHTHLFLTHSCRIYGFSKDLFSNNPICS